ncbi:DUF4064 domain-containing protein [Listeria aquatica]|uniref:DUF4064 domain-containing protein n=1 Tax=Listeria aquatica TaxID=1494960 RepID=A0A841ZSV4_9LIST|nr:DUF4064 domain-containing protein [Listeria aquatica]MBC1522338.1 DUF4064 domain-containing protein [Listeria aquatica]
MNPRKAEFVLTLIAGITGIIAGLFGILGGGLIGVISQSSEFTTNAAYDTSDMDILAATSGMVVILAILALIVGILLFIFSFFIKKNAKLWGILTLILGVIGFFLVGFLWVVPGVLAVIAGIMCLARKVSI